MENRNKRLVAVATPSSGKATTMGNIISKCGGIDMLTLERLERGGINTYREAFNVIKGSTEPPYFYTPKNRVVVTEDASSADGLLLILTPGQIAEQLQTVANEVPDLAELSQKERVITLINKMDEHEWSADVFESTVSEIKASFDRFGWKMARTPIIPVSGLRGDNIVELSPNWDSRSISDDSQVRVNGLTVISALDQIL